MNRVTSPADVSMKRGGPGGGGTSTAWLCFGCNTNRIQLGSKGRGVFKRCAHCVAAKEQK